MRKFLFVVCVALLQSACAATPGYIVHADTEAELQAAARASYELLVSENESAAQLADEAVGVLVFPKVLKAGLTFGGQYGEGVLLESGEVSGYFNSVSASFGLQAGAQMFGYVLMITNDDALNHVKTTSGWEIGLGPSLVFADRGVGKSLTTTTVRSDIYAYVFNQKGLMAGSGLQGTKVSPIRVGRRFGRRREIEAETE